MGEMLILKVKADMGFRDMCLFNKALWRDKLGGSYSSQRAYVQDYLK
jgi:hypothetical protein